MGLGYRGKIIGRPASWVWAARRGVGTTVTPDATVLTMNIEYRHNVSLKPVEVARVFDASGIVRPTGDLPRIARMLAASNLVISAWADGVLVGVCRALTDYSYCCFLSDLAVDRAYQRRGIGQALIGQVRDVIGEEVSLILLSAPDALSYYPSVGFARAENAFVIKRAR